MEQSTEEYPWAPDDWKRSRAMFAEGQVIKLTNANWYHSVFTHISGTPLEVKQHHRFLYHKTFERVQDALLIFLNEPACREFYILPWYYHDRFELASDI